MDEAKEFRNRAERSRRHNVKSFLKPGGSRFDSVLDNLDVPKQGLADTFAQKVGALSPRFNQRDGTYRNMRQQCERVCDVLADDLLRCLRRGQRDPGSPNQ